MDCCLFVDDYICCGIQFWFSPRSGTSAQCRHPRIAAQQHCRVQGSAQVMCAGSRLSSEKPRLATCLISSWFSLQLPPPPAAWLGECTVEQGTGWWRPASSSSSSQRPSGQQVVFKCTAAMPHYLSQYLMDWIFSSLATHIFGSQSYHLSIWNKKKDWLSLDRTRRNFYDENHEKVSWTDRAWRV